MEGGNVPSSISWCPTIDNKVMRKQPAVPVGNQLTIGRTVVKILDKRAVFTHVRRVSPRR